jgi:alanine racemase
VDGYPTGAVKACAVLLGGRLRPVVGTVSASHTVVALGNDESVKPGDEAIAVGSDDPAIHPNEVAKRSDWSEYNMFMHLNPSLARIVSNA